MAGGSIEVLRSFLNVKSDHDFVLVVAWALAVLRNRGPYPVIVLSGEQGSAKSTFSAILRRLLDPNTAPLRALPREDRDLFIAASNGHVLAFDNVSVLPGWISDTLCRLATGGGFAVRQLYTDGDEVLFDAERPVILNGIEEIVTRPDLADRAVFLTLAADPGGAPPTRAGIVGRVRGRATAHPWRAARCRGERLGRVAATRSSTSCPAWRTSRCGRRLAKPAPVKDGSWPQGTFWAAYSGNRDEAVEGVIDADPVATAVRAFMAKQAAEQAATAGGDADGADGVDGNCLGSSGRPCRGSGRAQSPSQRPGLIVLGHCRAGCGGRRPSCARSVSISPSRRQAGRGRGPSPSPPLFRRQKSRGNLRPHRPHRPPIREKPIPAMASRLSPRGRKPAMRTQTRAMRTVAAKATIRPSAPTP